MTTEDEDLLTRIQRLVDEELAHAFRPMLMQTLGIGGAFMVVGIFAALYFAKLFSEGGYDVFVGDGAKEANTYLAREMRKPYDYSMVM